MKKLLPLLFSFALLANEEEPPAAKIRSIVLLSEKEELLPTSALRRTNGVQVIGVDLPSSKSVLIEELTCLLSQDLTFTKEDVREIKEEIYEYYREYDHPFVLVSVPTQIPDTGALQLIVAESKLGKMEVKGNHWTKASSYKGYFSTKSGQPISQKRLISDVNFMNRNPYRQVSVAYSPGEEPYTTDLTLEVSDRKPYSFYAGFDNNGIPTTNRQRVFAGFSWDQLFGFDHTFFYQYTTNYHVQRYHSNSFQYRALLPWRAVVDLYGGFSIVSTNLPFMSSNKGTNIQASVRYTTPFVTNAFFSQELILGFDVKNTNNTIEFVDIAPVFGQTVNLTQWMIGYACKYEKEQLSVEGGVEGYFSPFEWIPNQSQADFQTLRPGAKNKWFYGIGYVDLNYPLAHGCNFHFRTKVEGSSAPLLPSEQLGIGGWDSVRGYDTRQYSADNGIVSSFEFHLPRFSLFSSKKPSLSNYAYFLAFADGGFGFDEVKVPQIPWSDYLISAGAGIRYRLGSYLTARFDYGFKLHRQADFTGGNSLNHFSVSGSF